MESRPPGLQQRESTTRSPIPSLGKLTKRVVAGAGGTGAGFCVRARPRVGVRRGAACVGGPDALLCGPPGALACLEVAASGGGPGGWEQPGEESPRREQEQVKRGPACEQVGSVKHSGGSWPFAWPTPWAALAERVRFPRAWSYTEVCMGADVGCAPALGGHVPAPLGITTVPSVPAGAPARERVGEGGPPVSPQLLQRNQRPEQAPEVSRGRGE